MEKRITPASLFLLLCLLSLPQSSCQQYYTTPYVTPHETVSENAKLGDVINTIRDTAPNSPGKIVTVVYRGSTQDFYASKVPDQPVWNVTLNRTLDYETQTRFDVVFETQGAENQSVESTEARFVLHVRDENDNAPQFLHLPYNAEVDEDAILGTSVNISILATDVDTGAGGKVSYELVPVSQGSDSEGELTFRMDPQHGHVTLNGSLDYETKTFYHYQVVAKDQGSPALSSSTDLFITVQDVQDSPPLFVSIPYVASLHENAAPGTAVLTVRAVDQDRAIPNTVTYNVTHSTCPGLFEVDTHSGVISVSGQLDTDSAPLKDLGGLCTIQLQATEENSKANPQKGNFTATATAAINVLDLNDNAPVFSPTSVSASITENAPAGTPVQLDHGQQIGVSDRDQGPNSAIQLSLVTEVDTFELTTPHVQSSGPVQLRVKNNTRLDYERAHTLTVKIQASDTQHRPVTATVTVTVMNMNEFTPQFTQSAYTASLQEGSQPGTPVISVSATDDDDGDYGVITYSLNNARGLFTIDTDTGNVSVASNHTDREREDRYYLMLLATDGGGLQQTVPLTLTISDVNDNPPFFLRLQYDVILRENSTAFSRDVTVQTIDADEKGTQNTNVTYSITKTTPLGLESHFQLDPVSGHLRVVQALDYDTLDFPASSPGTVALRVQARDNGTPQRLSATASVVVTLLDLNDHTPILQNVHHTVTVQEGSTTGTFVHTITATDGDGSAPNNLITYSIESGGQDRFQINPDTGTLSVSGKLDREQVSSYTLIIVAKDRAAAPRSSSSRISIHISDVNDELPSFGDKDGKRIKVNEGESGVLYDMSATDPDLHTALKYEMRYDESSAQPNGVDSRIIRQWIKIDPHSGNITAKKVLDRTKVQMFVLRVSVTDTKGTVHTPQQTNATLTLSVEDINDHSPHFSPAGPVLATIRENMGTGTALTFPQPLRVGDLDQGVNSLFEVTVTGQSSRYFEVLPTTVQSSADLQVTVRNNSILDYERHPSINITLLAKETNTSRQLSSEVRIEVGVEDENDHSPRFAKDTYRVAIAEARPAGTSVTVISATDADGSSKFNTISYSLQGAENIFAINSSTGVVTLLTSATDYDTPPNSYQLTVLASDNQGRRANALLVVTLTDINDLSPHFDRPEYSATLKEEHTDFETPLVIHAVDGDQPGTPASNVTYRLLHTLPPPLSATFRVPDPYSGVIEVVTKVDLESLTSDMITLTLEAKDGGGLTSNVTAKIRVVDVNDQVPRFPPSSSTAAVVLEDAPVGTLVYTFNATDADRTSPNNVVTYLISSGANDQFSLDEHGHLNVSRELDRERASRYSLVVVAVDRGVPQNTGTTTLAVQVKDVNDVPPEFLHSSVTIQVKENTAGEVYTMNATDADVDHQLVYSIVRNDSDLFQINPSTGTLRVNGVLDRETMEHAVIVVQVQDSKSQTGPQTATGRK